MVLAKGQVPIREGAFVMYPFTITAARCAVDMRVQGLEGGVLDLETYVFDEYNYLNWKSSLPANGVFNSGRNRIAQGTIRVGPGKYVLVVSNRFSVFTPKKAAVEAVISCQ